jgi:hypothetical protein
MSKKTCETCRFWSQMCAMAGGGEPLKALCLHPEGNQTYRRERESCANWKINSHGVVDEPPDYGERARAMYEAEEASQ